jgi:hypothetical protein
MGNGALGHPSCFNKHVVSIFRKFLLGRYVGAHNPPLVREHSRLTLGEEVNGAVKTVCYLSTTTVVYDKANALFAFLA